MADRVGTSGWSYEEWKGTFYPDDLPASAMLAHYATRLDAVEVNNTFYRLPKRSVVEAWVDEVPSDFRFVIKASRRITHQAKLGPGAREPLDFLTGNLAVLGERLGALLIQTPPWLKADLDLLATFLDWIPEGIRTAFEFRSTSWFDTPVAERLAERGHALVAADTGDPDRDPPLTGGGGWCYARLRKESWGEGELEAWAARLAALDVDDRFVFFKHEDAGAGPVLAARFAALLKAQR